MKIIHSSQTNPYLLNPDQERTTLAKHTESKRELTVPRRPAWDSSTTPAELDRAEKDSFLQWRRGLAQLEESKDLLMTPFERNLEVWRQLWRVIERSDLVVQIVDARNPLLFRSEDLERYVLEVGAEKRNLLLVNKADMMTLEQRTVWAEHFEREGIRYRFFSAALAKQSNEEMEFSDEEEEEEESGDEEVEVVEEIVKSTKDLKVSKETPAAGEEDWEDDASDVEPKESIRTRILTIDELEDLFLEHAPAHEGKSQNTLYNLYKDLYIKKTYILTHPRRRRSLRPPAQNPNRPCRLPQRRQILHHQRPHRRQKGLRLQHPRKDKTLPNPAPQRPHHPVRLPRSRLPQLCNHKGRARLQRRAAHRPAAGIHRPRGARGEAHPEAVSREGVRD